MQSGTIHLTSSFSHGEPLGDLFLASELVSTLPTAAREILRGAMSEENVELVRAAIEATKAAERKHEDTQLVRRFRAELNDPERKAS